MTEPILCPWCGHEMTLVHLSGWFPPDIRNRYTCLHCMADAPCGTDEQDAYEKARIIPAGDDVRRESYGR